MPSDPYPLPYCPACKWTSPSYHLGDERSAWMQEHPVYVSGPVDWRSYPGLHCHCRLMWTAEQKGLLGEACGGHAPAYRGNRTAKEFILRHEAWMREEIWGIARERTDEACCGRGPGQWTTERLVKARMEQAATRFRETLAREMYEILYFRRSPIATVTSGSGPARGVDDWSRPPF